MCVCVCVGVGGGGEGNYVKCLKESALKGKHLLPILSIFELTILQKAFGVQESKQEVTKVASLVKKLREMGKSQ